MVSIDGILYHAVNINDMPDNAVIFAAPNSTISDPSFFFRHPKSESLEQSDANLGEILKQF